MAEVSLKVGAFTEKLEKGLNKAKGKIAQFTAFVKKNEAKIKKARLGSAAALAAGILIMRDLTKAYGVQEQAEIGLAQAMKNLGTYTAERFEQTKAYAAELQKLSNFGDEEIIQAQALLITLGRLSGEGLDRATQATLDLAVGLKMDLGGAAALLAKTIGSTTNALTRYGIEIDNNLKGSERTAALLDVIEGKMSGQAAAAAGTMTGKLKQMSMAWGDLKEDLGEAILPMLVKLAEYLSEIIPKVAKWVQENQKLVMVLAGGGIGGAGLTLVLTQFALVFSNPVTGIIVILAAAAAGIALLAKRMKDLRAEMKEMPTTLEGVEKEIENVAEQIAKIVMRLEGTKEIAKEVFLQKILEVFPVGGGIKGPPAILEHLAILRERLRALIELKKEMREDMKPEATVDDTTQGLIPIPTVDDIDAINAVVDAYEEGFEQLDELHDAHVKKWISDEEKKQKSIEDIAKEAGWGLYNIWANSFANLGELSKQYNAAFLLAMIDGLIGTLEMAIEMYIQRVVAKEIAAMAEAGLEGLFNPAAWGKIALAGVIAGTAIASLRGISGSARASMMKSVPAYEYGGVVPETGLAMVHKGEHYFNPNYPGESLANLGGGMALHFHNYGDLDSKKRLHEAFENFEERLVSRRMAGRLSR